MVDDNQVVFAHIERAWDAKMSPESSDLNFNKLQIHSMRVTYNAVQCVLEEEELHYYA